MLVAIKPCSRSTVPWPWDCLDCESADRRSTRRRKFVWVARTRNDNPDLLAASERKLARGFSDLVLADLTRCRLSGRRHPGGGWLANRGPSET
jgi:hypothetical protein